jgi:hypothetical protein
MSPEQWLSARQPHAMLGLLRDRGATSARKLRLFCCACARLAWGLLVDRRGQAVVEVAELQADGAAPARRGAESAKRLLAALRANPPPLPYYAELAAAGAAGPLRSPFPDAAVVAGHAAQALTSAFELRVAARLAPADLTQAARRAANRLRQEAQARMTGLLRCIFGSPFQPFSLPPACLTPTTLALAHAAYDDRTLPEGTLKNDRLAVLADAMEDADCDDAELLGHLRSDGAHVRGCWAVDAVLQRA